MSEPQRLFVAVRPSPEARDALAGLNRPEEAGLRFTPPAQWHVTLRFLGRSDPAEVLVALSGERLVGCTAELGPSVAMLGNRVVVVPVAGLDDLAVQVRRCTRGIGQPPEHPFRGHLTVARVARAGCWAPGPPLGEPIRVRWVPREIELVSSVTMRSGAVHRVIETFPIG